MDKQILNFCIKKGLLLDKDILNLLSQVDLDIAKDLIEQVEYHLKEKVITKSLFKKNLGKIKGIITHYDVDERKNIEKFFINLGLNIELVKEKIAIKKREEATKELQKQLDSSFRIVKLNELPIKKIEVADFVKNFRSRFNLLKNILQERIELQNLVSIDRISENKQVSIIAMVSDKRVTKNKNILLRVEDLTGEISALVNKNRPEIYEKAKEIILDDVIGLKCSSSGNIVFVNDIIFPDIFLPEKKNSRIDEAAAFISDIHTGSNKFLEKNFSKFISWLNGLVGSEQQKKEALKIKYLFILGDTIDGVGVYPTQESELEIKDIKKQYDKLAEFLSKIREDVKIFLCPGQHDAVRIAEPQPIIDEYFAPALYNLKNLILVTNPAFIEIGSDVKFKVLMYHGASMHGLVNEIDNLRLGKGHDSPTDIIKYLLKKRHLAPTHSLVVYLPNEKEDSLVIDEVPDIIATGELHRPEVGEYNNILLIAASCWQSLTPFEEKVGNHPDPCKVPVFNLKTREIKIIDFG